MALQNFANLRARVDAGNDAIDKIGTIEGSDQHGRIGQFQLLHDIGAHTLRRRSGVSMDAGFGKTALDLGQAPILGTEVVPPVADAMRFVNGEGAHLHALDELQETGREQSLRRHEQKAIAPCKELLFNLAQLVLRRTAIKCRSRIAAFPQTIDLILH